MHVTVTSDQDHVIQLDVDPQETVGVVDSLYLVLVFYCLIR